MSKPKPKRDQWRQIGGDMNPSQHGAVIARFDGNAVDIFEIQPVRSYVGDGSALEVGFPFWSRVAYYDGIELDPTNPEVRNIFESQGFDASDLPDDPDDRCLMLAECLLRHGYRTDEGDAGWAKDVLGDRRVLWWAETRPRGWRYLADEDQEFRALQRESKR